MIIASSDKMTLEQALIRLDDATCPQRPYEDLASIAHRSSFEWDLGADFGLARQFANEGWREKSKELEGYLATIKNLVDQSTAFTWDVSGEIVDVGRFLSGEPECMLSFPAPTTKSVKLLVNISARASASASMLLNRGIAVAALVYALQAAGTGVSLSIGEWVKVNEYSSNECHETLVEVNQSSDYINPARLAFWLAHPAVLRRCIFRYNEQQPDATRSRFGFTNYRGYGYPTDPSIDILKQHNAIYFPFPETSESGKYQTPQVAFQTIKDIAEKQGIHLAKINL